MATKVDKPSGGPVKDLRTPRELNNALQLIREQIFRAWQMSQQAIDLVGQTTSTSSSSADTIAQLQQQVAALTTALAALQQGSLAPTATYRADAAITGTDVVFPTSDGGVSSVDTQDPTQIFGAIGIATSSAAVGADVVVRRSGTLSGVGSGWEPGRAIYAQVGGGLTQVPNYAAVAIPVGVAISATDMDVRAAWPALRELPLYSGGFEDFLPVTLQLVRAMTAMLDSLAGQPDGLVVKIDDVLTTRVLIAGSGSGLVIDNADGVDGDPAFRLG